MHTKVRPLFPVAALGATLLVTACGGGGGGEAQGTVRMALTDAPACGYDHVYVTVEKVRLHKSDEAAESEGGWEEIVLATPKRLDLLELTNGTLEELGQTEVPSGSYRQVRLVLAENQAGAPLANAVQPTGGALVPLRTPSAQQSGLKLKTRIDVEPAGLADLVLDFDACRSVVKAGNSGAYNLKPVLSLAQRVQTGIQGYVSTTMTLGSTLVSAQQNGVVVRSSAPDATGRFVLPFLGAGNYDVVITSAGRATAVLTSVPVSTATTTLNGTATAFLPPTSAMRQVSGTARTGTVTPTTVTTADVRATQPLTGGPVIQVAATPVDATDGTYRFDLPAAAPVKASYTLGGTPVFAADVPVAGKYTVQASAPGFTTGVTQAADVSTANAVVDLQFGP
ncbi:DUF4382 domain-containing protein [Ramlibacter rhizophilus]|uniref:DUF4382 domain-containing protein n=1 Tax=Ramlibacter rhizophilus TaxID=1781167 RepID=A0A4Z0BJI8_9BURK|nr:DUF4382 domain-containing protein [Ramlibacter rhizophilus]TFY98437.1 DUF4382 domain-containing protein [Ramlibacter rhizophilus]